MTFIYPEKYRDTDLIFPSHYTSYIRVLRNLVRYSKQISMSLFIMHGQHHHYHPNESCSKAGYDKGRNDGRPIPLSQGGHDQKEPSTRTTI